MTEHWTEVYAAEIRAKADTLAESGDQRVADIYTRFASELLQRRAAYEDQPLTNVEAAREGGFSPQALGQMRRARKWTGTRRDLPRKAQPIASTPALELSATGSNSIAAKVLTRQNGRSSNRRSARA